MVYVMGWQSRTANLLDSGEAARVFRGLGFTDVLKLDGGGSYYQSRDGAVSKTAENRRINSVLRWTAREEEPELTEDRVRQIVREELAAQEAEAGQRAGGQLGSALHPAGRGGRDPHRRG